MVFDAHFHYPVCKERGLINLQDDLSLGKDWGGLSCAHSFSEWEEQCKSPSLVFHSFGIHPQLVGELFSQGDAKVRSYMEFLEGLAAGGKLHAVGEIGFDLFTDDFKKWSKEQDIIWQFQLEIALKYNLPIVVHCRKANNFLFKYASQMKKLPGVLFHSFMGSLVEAESLIKRNINCFFSFGKQMMNNNKKVIDCVKNLPLENLLIETDGPFQTLKGEENTLPSDIFTIYKECYKLRNEDFSYEEFIEKIFNNVKSYLSTIQI